MSILDLAEMDLNNAIDLTVAPAGEEAKLRIVSVKEGTNKNNEAYILPAFEVEGRPEVKEFTRYFGLPYRGQDAKKKNNAQLALRDFLKAIGHDISAPLDTDAMVGCTCWALLGIEEDPTYGEKNYIKRFVLPQD